jgi:hypothetical protein
MASDTAYTLFITIAIFILGYIINRLIETNKEARCLSELEDYFLKLIELLEDPLVRQKNILLKFSQTLKLKKDNHLFFQEVSAFNVELIREINNQDLYKIFIKNKKLNTPLKTKLFQKLKGNIEYLKEVKKSINLIYTDLTKRLEKYHDRYTESLKVTWEYFDNISTQNVIKDIAPEDDLFFVNLDEIRNTWIEKSKEGDEFTSKHMAREYYLNPITKLCQNNIHNPRASYMPKYIFECIYALDNFEEVRYVYRRNFLTTAREIQKSMIEIKSSLKQFAEM